MPRSWYRPGMSDTGREGPPRDPGAEIDGWRIRAVLDDGATSLTYRVGAIDSDQVGVLRLLTIKDPSFAERLRRNAAALAGNRDHLVPVLAVVEHNGFTGVVTRWIDGPDLGTWARGDAPLAHRLALFRDVMAGLAQAHEANLVHRNLKPVKIRVEEAAPGAPVTAYLEDFLLSRVDLQTDASVTAMGITFGTPQYMSPEQFHGAAEVSARGDLFSAGCVLYELVTGKRAFDGSSIRDVYMAIIDGEYTDPKEVAPDLPEPVVELIQHLLQPATEDRPASAAAVLETMDAPAFAALLERPTVPTPPPDPLLDPPEPRAATPELAKRGPAPSGTNPATRGPAPSGTPTSPAKRGPAPSGTPTSPAVRGPEAEPEAPPASDSRPPAAFPTLLAPDELDEDTVDPPPKLATDPADATTWADEPLEQGGLSLGNRTLWLVAGVAFGGGAVVAFLIVLLAASWFASG